MMLKNKTVLKVLDKLVKLQLRIGLINRHVLFTEKLTMINPFMLSALAKLSKMTLTIKRSMCVLSATRRSRIIKKL